MSKPSYLIKRDGLYFAVVNIPRKLQYRLKRKQIWRSLKTGTYNIAITNLKMEVGSIMSFLELLADKDGKEALTAKYYKAIIEKIIIKLLNDDQERRIGFAGAKNLLTKQKSLDTAALKNYEQALSKANYKAVENSIISTLGTSGLLWDADTKEYKNLCMAVLIKTVEAYKVILNRYDGIYGTVEFKEHPFTPHSNVSLNELVRDSRKKSQERNDRLEKATSEKFEKLEEDRISRIINKLPITSNITPERKTLSFEKLIHEFNKSKEIVKKNTATKDKYSTYQRLLTDCIGKNTDITTINRKYFRGILDLLEKMPKNVYKISKFKNLSMSKIAELSTEDTNTLTASSINDYLEHLQLLMTWAKREEYSVIDDFRDLRAKDNQSAKNKRASFNDEMLKKIFASSLMTESSTNFNKAHFYWITVLGLVTGMRVGEICQLKVGDVRKAKEIDYISVNEEANKSVKNDQSVRDIPINDFLKQAGFMKYVASVKAKRATTDSLFPNLTIGEKRKGDPFSKKFASMLKQLDIKGEKITFHSTRHTYRDYIRESDLLDSEQRLAIELAGWKEKGSVSDDYGSGYSYNKKLTVLNKINYGNLAEII